VTNSLFDDGERGIDLIAINMQRGRDHGLPGYAFYRQACRPEEGLAKSFEDFRSDMTPEVC
jgi:peroxidase